MLYQNTVSLSNIFILYIQYDQAKETINKETSNRMRELICLLLISQGLISRLAKELKKLNAKS